MTERFVYSSKLKSLLEQLPEPQSISEYGFDDTKQECELKIALLINKLTSEFSKSDTKYSALHFATFITNTAFQKYPYSNEITYANTKEAICRLTCEFLAFPLWLAVSEIYPVFTNDREAQIKLSIIDI